MRNIALILMYNGTAYHGWQVQKTEVSVAATLERGLSMVCGEPIRVTGCGRTDAGVHAEFYVANFHTASPIPVDRLPFAVNTHIPEDIVETFAEQLIVGGFEIVKQEGFQSVFSTIHVLVAYQTVNVLCIRLDQFLQHMNAKVTRGTSKQHIAQGLAFAVAEAIQGVVAQ